MSAPLGPDGLPPDWNFRPEWETTPRATRDAMAAALQQRPILLDCRRADERGFNRIEGSIHIPMSEVEQRLDELEAEDGSRTRPIIIYCHHGQRSLRTAMTLRAHGFDGARSMAGGIDLWSVDIDPGVPRY